MVLMPKSNEYDKQKIAIFIDVQNVYYTVKERFGCHFNYRELWRQLSLLGEIKIAHAYAIEPNDSQQKGFQKALLSIGYTVKLKPFIQRRDGSAKGDWDVGLAVDMMDAITDSLNPIDCVVLLSGDGDFDYLLRRVSQDSDIRTLVYSVADLTAHSLILAATEHRPIDDKLLLR
jgi:uncharacterized LabA/DUF88 family protein